MIAKLSLAAGLLVAVAALAPHGASAAAAPQSPLPGLLAVDGSLVQKAQWGRCRHWRHECAHRWGWGTPGFHRCLWRHGC
jgi:hypothetical protein